MATVDFYTFDEEGNIGARGRIEDGGVAAFENARIGVATDMNYVVNGELREYTPEQYLEKRNRPPYTARWSNTAMGWQDLRTLDELKTAKWSAMKRCRSNEEFGTLTWQGSQFDIDATSQARIQGACQLATLAALNGQAFSIDWTLADNTVRTLTGADMLAVGQAMGARIAAAHAAGRAARAAIEAAATKEQVEAVAWPGLSQV